jgi:hypothetical protein
MQKFSDKKNNYRQFRQKTPKTPAPQGALLTMASQKSAFFGTFA